MITGLCIFFFVMLCLSHWRGNALRKELELLQTEHEELYAQYAALRRTEVRWYSASSYGTAAATAGAGETNADPNPTTPDGNP